MPTRVAIVPHTHWDREWYSPFQTFRLRLVKLLDTLLPMLEHDLSYSRFLLDGQTAVLDDYLEVRPEGARRARTPRGRGPAVDRSVDGADGRVHGVGRDDGPRPADRASHAASRARRRRWTSGTSPTCSVTSRRCPSCSGSQDSSTRWCGAAFLPQVEQTAFWWEAPDGSRVRAEYLYGSYSNGRDLPDDAKRLVLRAVDYEHELGPARLGDMLLMNGTDHQMPQPWLGRVVAEANAIQDDYEFVVTSLPEYLPQQPTTGLVDRARRAAVRARARTCSWAWVRTASTCTAAAPAAERSLERRAEPLVGAVPAGRALPARAARRSRGANSCSTARTTRRARAATTRSSTRWLVRYAEARQIGDGLTRDAVHDAGGARSTRPPARPSSSTRPRGRAPGSSRSTVPGTGPCALRRHRRSSSRRRSSIGEVGGEGYRDHGDAARRCAGCST